MARHVRKGDSVIVTTGSSRGQIGEIVRVIPDKHGAGNDRVVVKGINLRTKHLKPTRINPQGGIITKEVPLHISNVSPVVDGKPTRVRFESRPDGSKVRIAVRGGKVLSELRSARSGAAPTRSSKSKARA
jgi:large subunit ribosomal protein L24